MRIQRAAPAALALVLVAPTGSCEPTLVAGTYTEPGDEGNGGMGGSAGNGTCSAAPDYDPAAEGDPVDVPWSTGFEDEFCGYTKTGGFCYADTDASFDVVDSPVHGGRFAAAFSVTTDPSKNGRGTRCARQGVLPPEATYGAWFYIPSLVESSGNWNLIHFQGGAVDDWHGLWDVSLTAADDGTLYLGLFDFLNGAVRAPSAPLPVPIGTWFHVEFHLRRAKDANGIVGLYQDGARLLEVSGIVTDDSDVAQWYLGNLAEALTPYQLTIYVDDVTLRTP